MKITKFTCIKYFITKKKELNSFNYYNFLLPLPPAPKNIETNFRNKSHVYTTSFIDIIGQFR